MAKIIHTGAFNAKRYEQINDAIKRLATRAVAFHQVGLTHDDLMHLLVKPSDREHCIAAKRLFGVPRSAVSAKLAVEHGTMNVVLTMQTNTRHTGVALPKYAGMHLYADNEEANARLTAWADWRVQRAAEWGNVAAVFWELNSRCETPEQMRAVMEGIVPLLDTCMDVKDSTKPCVASGQQAERLRSFRMPAHMPRLPLELKRAALEASNTLARVALLPCHIKEPPSGFQQVTLSVTAIDMPPRAWTPSPLPVLNTGY